MPIDTSRKKKIFINIAIPVVFFACFLGVVYYAKQVSPNRDDAKLEAIKLELAKIPIYPSFRNVDEDYTSRYKDASATLYFRSNESLGRVRNFYDRELPNLGWQLKENADYFYYYKNDLRLSINYDPNQSQWNFALGIDWRNNPADYLIP